MEQVLEAIYSNGVLKPLEPLNLPENQLVMITIHFATPERPEDALAAWQQVYAGFSEEEIAEVEHIVLDRSHFMGPE
jgi:predicted DNA-binding antitoxin AbrB/MazE fold protein